MKVLDGNCLAGRERRLKELRGRSSAPPPGKALVVFDPALETITDFSPCEDAYTQERALLGPVLETVQAGQLWMADRNFCTRDFLWQLVQRGADGLIREHEGLRFRPCEAMQHLGRIDTGQVSEQRVEVALAGQDKPLILRRIRLHLDEPTRDGEETLYLLTTLPAEAADACTLAALYRRHWTIEQAFLHLTVQLRCEIDTLGYPPAALFGLAVAVVTYTALAVLKAALRRVHGSEAIDAGISGYYIVNEMNNVAESLETMVDAEDWRVFHDLTLAALVAWLLETAQRVNLRKYRKHSRGPKKPGSKRKHDPKRPHVSTA